jgi:hypothetical protein
MGTAIDSTTTVHDTLAPIISVIEQRQLDNLKYKRSKYCADGTDCEILAVRNNYQKVLPQDLIGDGAEQISAPLLAAAVQSTLSQLLNMISGCPPYNGALELSLTVTSRKINISYELQGGKTIKTAYHRRINSV